MRRLKNEIKKIPKLKAVKSKQVFQQMIGSSFRFIEITEVVSMAELGRILGEVGEDPEIGVLYGEFMSYVMPGTHSSELWNSLD